MNFYEILFCVLISWNVITFALMGIDKSKAENNQYRINEKALFTSAFLFGSFGIYLGMFVFRHKTKHWAFKIFIPLLIAINMITIYFLSKTTLFY